jgi:hypothetical protein
MNMKKLIIPVVAAAFMLLTMQNCSKGGGGSCSEPAMTVVTTPANGSVEPPGVGPNFDVQVNITANKPSAGVTIEVKAHPDGSSTNFFTTNPPVSSTNANNTITITGTPPTVACVVEIIVTSKSCASNKVTLSYKYSKK